MLDRPIIVFGTGRCGSTIFHKILSTHPNVAWLTRWMDMYPTTPERNQLLMRALDIPLISNVLKEKVSPGECYEFWEYHIKGFRRPCRDLTENDVMKHHHKVSEILDRTTTKRRNRLILKITGWPRVGFLKALFPHAKFIQVIRDGRAVTASNLRVGFWKGWEGPEKWRWGELSPKYKEEWINHHRSFLALGGIQWKILMDAAEEATKDLFENNYMEIRYEDLCNNPALLFKNVVHFCELDWSAAFERSIKNYSLKNSNYKWEKNFSDTQKNILNSVLMPVLQKYGYSGSYE